MALVFPNSRFEVAPYVRQVLRERPVYLDTETTGLGGLDEIVEISIVDDDGCALVNTLVRPTQRMPLDVIRIHGITDEMVRLSPLWRDVWPDAWEVMKSRPVVIYNASFDLRLIQQSHARNKMQWRETINTVCAMQLYSRYRGSYQYVRLEEARQQCRLSFPNSHRAAADAMLTRALFHFMAEHEYR